MHKTTNPFTNSAAGFSAASPASAERKTGIPLVSPAARNDRQDACPIFAAAAAGLTGMPALPPDTVALRDGTSQSLSHAHGIEESLAGEDCGAGASLGNMGEPPMPRKAADGGMTECGLSLAEMTVCSGRAGRPRSMPDVGSVEVRGVSGVGFRMGESPMPLLARNMSGKLVALWRATSLRTALAAAAVLGGVFFGNADGLAAQDATGAAGNSAKADAAASVPLDTSVPLNTVAVPLDSSDAGSSTPLNADDVPLRAAFLSVREGDHSKAAEKYLPLAKAGNRVAQRNLGLLYATAPKVHVELTADVFFCGLGSLGAPPRKKGQTHEYAGVNDAKWVTAAGVPAQRAAAVYWLREAAQQYHTASLKIWDGTSESAVDLHNCFDSYVDTIKALDAAASIEADKICTQTCPIGNPPPQLLPKTGILLALPQRKDVRTAPLELVSVKGKKGERESHFYVKLLNADTGRTEFIFFVRYGESFSFPDVPFGNYKLRYASGVEPWYGKVLLFRRRTSFSEITTPLPFGLDDNGDVRGFRITFDETGNLPRRGISSRDFGSNTK